jgi:3-keto-5-aminohexanoate cleavage enzyme
MGYSDYMAGDEMVLSVAPTAPEQLSEDAALPVTPETIATQVGDCTALGTTIASVHGWTDSGNRTPTALPDVAAAVREQTEETLIEYAVGPDCPLGDYLDAVDTSPAPDLAQVRVTPTQHGSRGVTRLSRRDVDRFINELRDRGIKPNILLQGGRDIHELYRLLESDVVTNPVVTLRVGARDGAVATPRMLMALLDALPSSATVFVAATGPNQYPLTTQALFLGAHIRVGMADNRYLSVEKPVEHNRQLVRRVAETVYHSRRSITDIEATASRLSLTKPRVKTR